MTRYERFIREITTAADIEINGIRPWDIRIHNEALYKRIFFRGTLGLGEAYMEQWWDCERLDLFFEKILLARSETKVHFNFSVLTLVLGHVFTNMQSLARASQVAEVHYDLSNDFYRNMLDQRMIYSCGYWKDADNLDQAQEHKLDLICRKLELSAGQSLLDIGCGWGGLARFAAENYGVRVVGVTISKEQAALATENCRDVDVEIRLQDYRDVTERFDKVVSVGMFEHVGTRNYRTYMEKVSRLLQEDGLFLLHTIGHRYRTWSADPWVNKYIFPNGKIPFIGHIGKSINGLMIMDDWHNFGPYYADTLIAWHQNFLDSWPEFKDSYDKTFFRMWEYYLLCFAGAFRSRHLQLWQLVLSKPSRKSIYLSIR
jgi:cyclopropane-fatty-acyl-phospholipid synthase